MSPRFEDRHRELREADDRERATWLAGQADASDSIAAARALDHFEARTGPPVDDFVAAVRVLANCSPTADPFPLIAWERAHDDVRAKLAALDEASR